MQTVQFKNGDQMPIFGLGTWKSAPGEVYSAVREALNQGYRHIDCAPIYGNEAEVGKALGETFAEGKIKREDVWITSKLWNNSHSPEDVQPALEKTLGDLQLDYLDLYLIHWPVIIRKGLEFHRSGEDLIPLSEIPIAVTWEAMEQCVSNGLCKHLGVSNFSIKKLKELLNSAKLPPEMNQIELHPYLQQPAMLNYCRENDIHLTAYSPLGSLDRPARLKEDDEPVLLKDTEIQKIASKHDSSPAQVLISWAIQRNTVVIPKSTKPERLRENLEATKLKLTEQDMAKIKELDKNRRYVAGGFWAMEGSPYTLANLWDE